jgi:hypothetical protein
MVYKYIESKTQQQQAAACSIQQYQIISNYSTLKPAQIYKLEYKQLNSNKYKFQKQKTKPKYNKYQRNYIHHIINNN